MRGGVADARGRACHEELETVLFPEFTDWRSITAEMYSRYRFGGPVGWKEVAGQSMETRLLRVSVPEEGLEPVECAQANFRALYLF
jgi:hypothetical protein